MNETPFARTNHDMKGEGRGAGDKFKIANKGGGIG